MCGRLFINDMLGQRVSNRLGLDFPVQQNLDLRPTETVATLVMHNDTLYQQAATWGIQPAWSKTLLINAQAETVAEKKTFASAFVHNRCLVPCSGWFEWRDEGGARKQKYLFSHEDDEPVYMAGMLYPSDNATQLVTLTTAPTEACRPFHHRMPLLIEARDIHYWFQSQTNQLENLLVNNANMPINILAV
jgi:putative SOS response-associated peptidase YedK